MDIPEFITENVAIDKLKEHKDNYREHPDDQIKHINQSLSKHGFYKNIVVAKDYTVLAGHGVLKTALEMGLKEIPVCKLDIEPDSDDAISILVGDNEMSKLAMADDRNMSELLKQLHENGNLLGTGYDEMMLANLVLITRHSKEIKDLNEAAEWVGMPDYTAGESEIKVIVNFKSMEDRQEFFDLIQQECTDKSKSIWFPEKVNADRKSIAFK